jgi:amino acid permease
MIYNELNKRDSKNMSNIVASGTGITTILYIIIGVFGYATFALN